jgi:hypothetical protein
MADTFRLDAIDFRRQTITFRFGGSFELTLPLIRPEGDILSAEALAEAAETAAETLRTWASDAEKFVADLRARDR